MFFQNIFIIQTHLTSIYKSGSILLSSIRTERSFSRHIYIKFKLDQEVTFETKTNWSFKTDDLLKEVQNI